MRPLFFLLEVLGLNYHKHVSRDILTIHFKRDSYITCEALLLLKLSGYIIFYLYNSLFFYYQKILKVVFLTIYFNLTEYCKSSSFMPNRKTVGSSSRWSVCVRYIQRQLNLLE